MLGPCRYMLRSHAYMRIVREQKLRYIDNSLLIGKALGLREDSLSFLGGCKKFTPNQYSFHMSWCGLMLVKAFGTSLKVKSKAKREFMA